MGNYDNVTDDKVVHKFFCSQHVEELASILSVDENQNLFGQVDLIAHDLLHTICCQITSNFYTINYWRSQLVCFRTYQP
jgi:hypothetical protein